MNNSHDKLTKFNANNIINYTPDNKQETEGTNKWATRNYLQDDAPHRLSINMVPPIHVG